MALLNFYTWPRVSTSVKGKKFIPTYSKHLHFLLGNIWVQDAGFEITPRKQSWVTHPRETDVGLYTYIKCFRIEFLAKYHTLESSYWRLVWSINMWSRQYWGTVTENNIYGETNASVHCLSKCYRIVWFGTKLRSFIVLVA